MNFRSWIWDFGGLSTCRCLACARCRGQSPSTTVQLTHSLRTARMAKRLVPLLFPAVDQPISKLSSQVLLDCPRLAGAQSPSRVGNAHHLSPLNQPAQPSQQSVQF
jgi:hypothetical protein